MTKIPLVKTASSKNWNTIFKRWSGYLLLVVLVESCVVLLGWQFGMDLVKRPLPLGAAMNPATAFLFLLACIAFFLSRYKTRVAFRRAGYAISACIVLISLLRLADIIFHCGINADGILFAGKLREDALTHIPDHMAPNTAVAFLLTGISLLLRYENGRRIILSNFFSLIAGMYGLFSFLGYLYNIPVFYAVSAHLPMAIHTALCFVFFSLAVLFADPGTGIIQLLSGKLAGSRIARLLIPMAILVPAILGWLRLYGDWAGLFSEEVGVAVLVFGIAIVFFIIIWYNAILLNKRDGQRMIEEEKLMRFNEALEAEVKKKTAELLSIFERISEGFIALDKNFCCTYVNKRMGELFQRDPQSLLGKNLWEEFPQAAGTSTQKAFVRAMEEPKYMVNRDYYAPLELWLEIHIYPSAEGLSVFIKDISEEKKSQDRLKFKARLLKMVGQAVIAADTEGVVNYWNDAAEKLYGWTAEDAIGRNITDLIPATECGDLSIEIMKLLRNGGLWNGELVMQRRDGSCFPAFVTDAPVYEEGLLSGFIRIAFDITGRKKNEETLKVLELEIVEQKIQEQKKISRAIIRAQEEEKNHMGRELHDNICQILAGARIYLRIAAGKNNDVKTLLQYPLELIDNTVEEIRQLSRIQVTPLQNIDLRELTERLLETLKDHSISVDLKYSVLPASLTDDLKLNIYRVIQVQVNNIIKHAGARHVLLSLQEQDSKLVIVITDDGKGFDMSSRRKGIGLSGIINRVESFNGTTEIRSSPGKGCTITVTIPLVLNGQQAEIGSESPWPVLPAA